ncbi:MAG: hypothetical protein Ct9H300mP12_13150 [Acidimicrobiales bacterium]|nr:MAG: hypothetical protein Ct9H300mP12_13150 [Acidimicrobiales bacterium]
MPNTIAVEACTWLMDDARTRKIPAPTRAIVNEWALSMRRCIKDTRPTPAATPRPSAVMRTPNPDFPAPKTWSA